MSEWREAEVTVNGVRLHYIRTGNMGKPSLLLLHGMTDYGRYWSRTARELEDQFDIIMPDQRGHGASERPEAGYNVEDFAEDAAALIRELGLAPATVMGHSLGAAVTIALASTYPQLVALVVLLDPPLTLALSDEQVAGERDARLAQTRAYVLEEQQLTVDGLAQRCAEMFPGWSAEDCRYFAESHKQVYVDLIPQIRAGETWQEALPRIASPTLLVYGDKELGSIVDDDLAARVKELAPNVTPVRIDGSGHSPQRDQFDAYIAAIQKFLS